MIACAATFGLLACSSPPPLAPAAAGDDTAGRGEGQGRPGGVGGGTPDRIPATRDPLTDLDIVPVPSRPGAPALGPEDAPLQVVVFTDFQCPFCRQHAETIRRLVEHYGARLRVTLRQFPLAMHPMARLAAEAALAAHAQGRFWKYHDLLFETPGALLSQDVLIAVAQRAGLDMSLFRQALADGTYAAQVDKDLRDGAAAGVQGTPSTFINGRFISGVVPLEQLVDVCDRLLEHAE
jgi:protein-disulfide isomerase